MKNSLRNKRILITGINGFVGSALANSLKSLGAIVFGISKSGSPTKQVLKADILDYSSIDKFMRNSGIQICFHLASKALVEEGQYDPYRTFKVNVDGTLNILEAARNNRLEKVIIASTSHVYGKNKVPYVESDSLNPTRPYETSKACADLIAQSYRRNFNFSVIIPRFVNIYGPGDLNFQRLIPKTIKSVLGNSEPKMWGGQAVRDYLFIDDAVAAYLSLIQTNIKEESDGIFNFGGSGIICVEDLIKKIIKISGKNLVISKITGERGGEIESQYVSFDKAAKFLKWMPKIDLDEGLKRTIAWYLKYDKAD